MVGGDERWQLIDAATVEHSGSEECCKEGLVYLFAFSFSFQGADVKWGCTVSHVK